MLQRQAPALEARNLLSLQSSLKKIEIIKSYADSPLSAKEFAAYGQRAPKEEGKIIIRTRYGKTDQKI